MRSFCCFVRQRTQLKAPELDKGSSSDLIGTVFLCVDLLNPLDELRTKAQKWDLPDWLTRLSRPFRRAWRRTTLLEAD
jgi:hypothetical protein